MTPQQIIDGNRLIAQFMGLTVIENDPFIKGFDIEEFNLPVRHESLLKYHTSYNWLMPVFFKFKEIGFLDIESPNNYENYDNFIRKFGSALTYCNTPFDAFQLLVKEINKL